MPADCWGRWLCYARLRLRIDQSILHTFGTRRHQRYACAGVACAAGTAGGDEGREAAVAEAGLRHQTPICSR